MIIFLHLSYIYFIDKLNNDKWTKPSSAVGNYRSPIYYAGAGVFSECNVDLDGTKFSDELSYWLSTDDAVKAWVSSNYIRIDVFTTTVSYSSGYHKDINVTQLSGKSSVLGVISVNAFGTRRNASIGVVSASTSAYTISVTIYNAEGGGGAPAGIDTTYIQVWYYY